MRGGLKLKRPEDDPGGWVTQRLTRVIELGASGHALTEGIEYARLGQTKRLTIEQGVATAIVQGRRPKAYTTTVRMTPFTAEQKDKLVRAMADQAKYAASLLAGELPRSIEDLFGPLGMKLLPTDPDEFIFECSCFEDNKPWCKHAVCVATLLAERLGEQPLLVFSLRGFEAEELIKRLREQRSISSQGPGPAPVYAPQLPAAIEDAEDPLDADLREFWQGGRPLDDLQLPIAPPAVSHPLLRRLGPSPLAGRFPLVGLLATCYEVISEATIASADIEEGEEPADETGGGSGD